MYLKQATYTHIKAYIVQYASKYYFESVLICYQFHLKKKKKALSCKRCPIAAVYVFLYFQLSFVYGVTEV